MVRELKLVDASEGLWKTREVCEYLRFSSKKVYQLVGDGELPHVRIGGDLRFVPSQVRTWLENRQAEQ